MYNNLATEKKKNRNVFNFLFTRQKPTTESYFNEGIFGVPLCDAIKSGSILWGLRVPDPVYLCFLEIYKRGLKTEGLFRLSGATAEVISLENRMNMCSIEERKFLDMSGYDIHTLTSLVKKYLRDLPEPVIPNSFHEQFQSVNLFSKNAIHQLASIIISLPSDNKQLIHAIIIMIAQIQKNVDQNMMCPEALAIVFAPVLTGFEHSLKDLTTSCISTHSTFKRQKNQPQATTSDIISQHIKRNKHWTDIWILLIERYDFFIDILDKHHFALREQNKTISARNYRQHHCPIQNRTLPSSSFSTTSLSNDVDYSNHNHPSIEAKHNKKNTFDKHN
ncbi:hypothetical protein G6F37_005313 [Rhizopus arrhizus]|nr:hypothetical protein G6F38_010603 [Rhizopus arrhizus]KAG1158983.1 hypothetical protein G6F37_005313 [Rhizopus arrhizus]